MRAMIEKMDGAYYIYIYGSEGCDTFAVEQVDILAPNLRVQLKFDTESLPEEGGW